MTEAYNYLFKVSSSSCLFPWMVGVCYRILLGEKQFACRQSSIFKGRCAHLITDLLIVFDSVFCAVYCDWRCSGRQVVHSASLYRRQIQARVDAHNWR